MYIIGKNHLMNILNDIRGNENKKTLVACNKYGPIRSYVDQDICPDYRLQIIEICRVNTN